MTTLSPSSCWNIFRKFVESASPLPWDDFAQHIKIRWCGVRIQVVGMFWARLDGKKVEINRLGNLTFVHNEPEKYSGCLVPTAPVSVDSPRWAAEWLLF